MVYFHTDATGSVRMITSATGAVIGRYDFMPFGELWPANPPAATESRQFTGAEREADTKLDYFGARSYRPVSGRFITVDPGHVNGNVFDPQTWNGYAYARNNPLKYTDPTGTEYEICAEGAPSCQRVSDQYFAYLERNPGAGIQLFGGYIYAGGRGVGTYRQTSIDPTFADFVRVTGALSSRWLHDQSTEMAIGAAIAATAGLATGVLGGGFAATATLGLKAPTMTEIANATASGARMANLSVNLTAGEFRANLVRGGYRVAREGVGSNGPFTVLTKGEKTYTLYTASSTGGASAQVRVAGQTVSKIRLTGGF